jgi:hypothetical protein
MKLFKKILKWSTKIVSIAILTLVFYIIGAHIIEGIAANFSNFPESLSNSEIIATICLGSLIVGTLIGLKWELIGGVLAIFGYIGFMIGEGGFVKGLEFNVFLIIGVLNLVLYYLSVKNENT